MAGTKQGGQKTAQTNLKKYGRDYYKSIGAMGGNTPTDKPKGFAAMSKDKVRAAGVKGGQISRRGKSHEN